MLEIGNVLSAILKIKNRDDMDRIKHIFGIHKYIYIKRLSESSHQLGCKYCDKKFALNTSVRMLINWDLEIEDLYHKA